MSLVLILGIFFVVFSMITYAVMIILKKHEDPAVKRVREIENHSIVFKKSTGETVSERDSEPLRETMRKTLVAIGQYVNKNEESTSKLKQLLVRAGYRRDDSIRIFMGLRLLSSVLFFILFFCLGFFGDKSMFLITMMSALAGLAANRFPDVILNAKIRKRQASITSSLSDALDLLVISVEAGLGLNAAILRVGNDLDLRCPPLADEFRRVNQDLRTGISREEALRNLASRNHVEDLRILVSALIMADRLGTSIADTLRIQADSLRTRIRQKAEEQAAKAGIKMLLPLVLFILPALIIILMGPGLIAVYRTFVK
jgi:tight adherence protein C